MDQNTQKSRALRFLRLHKGPHILVLPNAWDVASARIFAQAGFRAIGTTSAGIAYSLGYPDRQRIPPGEMIAVVRRIAAAVELPVTADMEAGYGESPEQVAETARAVVAAGAAGMNLEDSSDGATLFDVARQVERIRAAIEAAEEAGAALVINARTDVYGVQVGESTGRYDEALRRLAAYRDAGAGCLFLPGVQDPNIIARMVRDLGAPLNILATTGTPGTQDLENMGVARVSVGSGPMRACLGLTRRIARELLERGTYTAITEGAVPYAEVNRLMK
jgi:2-methylisocitrate lyase-like PEP mutase family enzyme